MHDARLGRFLSVDPLARKFASNSQYSFSHNRVIDARELEGLENDIDAYYEAGFGTGLPAPPGQEHLNYKPEPRSAFRQAIYEAIVWLGDGAGQILSEFHRGLVTLYDDALSSIGWETTSEYIDNQSFDVAVVSGDESVVYARMTVDLHNVAREAAPEVLAQGTEIVLAEALGRVLTARSGGAAKNGKPQVKITRNEAPVTNEIYKRPNNATTLAQRKLVQGKPCVKCGAESETMVAGHKKALVEEHYETGTIDQARMRTSDAVQPELSRTKIAAHPNRKISHENPGI